MSFYWPIRGLPALLGVAALSAAAQTSPTVPAVIDRASSSVQQGPYKSAFRDYRPYSDEKLLGWKQSNDTVGAIGGWRVYAKQAQQATNDSAGAANAVGAVRSADDKPEGPAK